MKAAVLIFFLFATQISFIKCHSALSAWSCVISRRENDLHSQYLTNKIYRLLNPTDSRSADKYVFFYLYTKNISTGQKKEKELKLNDVDSIRSSDFNPDLPTKIITHGYINSKESPACTLPRDTFLDNGDYNVIVVDWYKMQLVLGTMPLDYYTVAEYVVEVGLHVASMIDFLEKQGMNLDTTTLIGHSLGAHVMGVAGFHTFNDVNYIIGLDPALPLFENREAGQRLSIEDARTVEVIHTNEGGCGFTNPIGHYDFYPNGGAHQPGCSNNMCSHSRVYEFYAESIISENGFFGRRCSDFEALKEGRCFGDLVKMGGIVEKRSDQHGMYYLETSDKTPYALGSVAWLISA